MAVDAAVYVGRADSAEALVTAGSRDPRPAGGAWQDIPYWAVGVAEEAGIEEEAPGPLALLPSLHHLWFLWFLVLFVICNAPVAWLADRRRGRTDPDAPRERWVGWLMWLLVPLVLLPQLAMEGGETIPAFGPDTSIGWVPEPHVFAYYLLFFAFGALIFGAAGRGHTPLVETTGRRWWLVLALALVALTLGLEVTFREGEQMRVIASGLQVAYAWLMIFGLMGLFRAVLSGEHRSVRYLSDSSYWQYLVHLTLVIALQAWVRTWDIPAALKFGFIVVTACAILLLTYQLFVRYTAIGAMLNGRRVRSSPADQAAGYEGLRAVSRKSGYVRPSRSRSCTLRTCTSSKPASVAVATSVAPSKPWWWMPGWSGSWNEPSSLSRSMSPMRPPGASAAWMERSVASVSCT
jgi:hypothetical protein